MPREIWRHAFNSPFLEILPSAAICVISLSIIPFMNELLLGCVKYLEISTYSLMVTLTGMSGKLYASESPSTINAISMQLTLSEVQPLRESQILLK